jgi:hypothetical protein
MHDWWLSSCTWQVQPPFLNQQENCVFVLRKKTDIKSYICIFFLLLVASFSVIPYAYSSSTELEGTLLLE